MVQAPSIFGVLEKLESVDITVHQNRCVKVRNRNASCSKCADACTSGALSMLDDQVVVTTALCIGCGTCATVCPTCALEAHHPNDAELLQRCLATISKEQGNVVIACEQMLAQSAGSYKTDEVVSLPCLGRVEESLLVALALKGVQQVHLVCGDCVRCDHAVGLGTAQLVCETTNVLLRAWDNDMRVSLCEKLPACSLLQEGETGAQEVCESSEVAVVGLPRAAESKFMKVMSDGTLPHFIPDRRERLLDSLALMGTPKDEVVATRLWGHVVVDTDLCVSCRMCATFCPTGAISKFDEEDGTLGIEHAPSDCVKCRCCTDICPEGAISISDEVLTGNLLKGVVDRYEMGPYEVRGDAHSILKAMRGLSSDTQIFER